MRTLLLALAGCGGAPDPGPDTQPAPGGPDIAVDATLVDLGRVRVGETLTGTLVLQNLGDDTLRVEQPVLEDGTGKFGVAALSTPFVLAGGELAVELTYAASAGGGASARLLVPSDDPDEPVMELVVVAHGAAPVLALDPPALDFGTLEERCEDTYALTLRNDGDEPLVVSGVEVEGGQDAFSVDLSEGINGPLPWTVAPGGAAQLWVGFHPTRELDYSAGLVVHSDDPVNTSAGAALDGVATENDRVVDDFLTFGKPLDFVFAVGGSDADSLAASLTAALPSLVAPLAAANVDFQVAAIRADDGCLVNGLLPNGTMTAEEQASALSALLAATGTEHTLTLVERALAESNSLGCNPDLMRARTNLVLVGLTDTATAAPQAHGVYSSTFEGTKSDPADTASWAIAPDGGDCGARDDAWYEVTVATGGSYLSVCDDLATSLATLAEASIERQDSFQLSRLAWPDTLVVQVDGTTTRAWTYDTASNAVVFDAGSAPTIGTPVRVYYDAIPVCAEE